MRVVADTNTVVSGLLWYGPPRQVLDTARTGMMTLSTRTDADFASSGLVAASLIRLSFLAILPRKNIAGVIGSIAPERHRRLLEALSNYLVRNLGGPKVDQDEESP